MKEFLEPALNLNKFVFLIKSTKMDLQTRKISFVQEFLRLTNEEIVISLERMLKKRKSEIYEEELKPMSIDKLNAEIDQALDDSRNDNVIKATDLKSKFKK